MKMKVANIISAQQDLMSHAEEEPDEDQNLTIHYSEKSEDEHRRQESQVDPKSAARFNYSAIFSVKEEFIFVFSGYAQEGLLNSVEVFDT
jgi:hypothetical protein